jgi:hypothetical protein
VIGAVFCKALNLLDIAQLAGDNDAAILALL